MAKRKRDLAANGDEPRGPTPNKKAKNPLEATRPILNDHGPVTIQIVAGSYDRVLHGVTATISHPGPTSQDRKADDERVTDAVKFADTFLFNAHSSAIRCLALSPPSNPVPGQTQKVLLATGSTDERINVYNLSAHPPSNKANSIKDQDLINSLAARPYLENPKNRELGTLLHHSSTVTRLCFPIRSKLLSAAEDSTIAVARTRDWNVLHSFKCPVPKAQGRPSGDTAAQGGVPSGVNDFAVHPSMTIMISVSKGERCMRLWNLVTGKKAGVHNFKKDMLMEIGEPKFSTGEARRITWGSCNGEDEFAVGFDRDIVVFGMDIKPKCRVMKDMKTKNNEFRYVKVDDTGDETLLAVSTDDGRILLFSTRVEKNEAKDTSSDEDSSSALPNAKMIAQVGGKDAGVSGRIKDFAMLPSKNVKGETSWYIVAGSSDGKLRVWYLQASELGTTQGKKSKQVGGLIGTYDTPNRITCVGAFIMIPRPDGAEDSEYEYDEVDDDSEDAENDGRD